MLSVSTWISLLSSSDCFFTSFAVSPLLLRTLRQRERESPLQRVVAWFRPRNEETTKNLRKTVTAQSMGWRVAILTFPQILIQTIALVLDTPYKSVEFNDDQSVGRAFCHSRNGYGTLLGFVVFGLLVLTLLSLAHQTRTLPSLFNETSDIFDSTLATLVIVLLGGGIRVVSSGATTSPAVDFMVGVGLALSCSLNTTVRIVLPKLRKIWRGETVLVSKLMSDHKVAVMKDDLLYRTKRRKRSRPSLEDDDVEEKDSRKVDIYSDWESRPISVSAHSEFLDAFSQELPNHDSEADLGLSNHSHKNMILLRQDQAPNRKLTLKLVNMQSCLKDINERTMAGMAVPKEDWVSVRRLSIGLASIFTREVAFAWETPLHELEGSSGRRACRRLSHDQSLLSEPNDECETVDSSELQNWPTS